MLYNNGTPRPSIFWDVTQRKVGPTIDPKCLLDCLTFDDGANRLSANACNYLAYKAGYTLVTLPRTVTPYRDSVDGTRHHVTYQKLVKR
jgi:hypothetical protein